MPLDAILLSGLRAELERDLEGTRVDKVLQPERDEIHLVLRGYRSTVRLLLSAGNHPRAHLTESPKENPAVPPMFCMLLRKHLLNARLLSVRQPPLERILDLEFESMDELGELKKKTLTLELMGRNANLILRDQENRVVDCLKKIDLSSRRQMLPGLFYQLPPGQDKRPFLDALSLSDLTTPEDREKRAADFLLTSFAGLSPAVCRELVYRACGDVDARLFQLELGRLEACLEELRELCRAGEFAPTLYSEGEEPREFSFRPLTQYSGVWQETRMDSFSKLLDAFYGRRDNALHMRQRAAQMSKAVQNHRSRLLRKLETQRQELAEARDREPLRQRADILTANLYRLERGMQSLTAENFYDPQGREITISLDPRLSPQENANRLYKTYAKRKTAEQMLGTLIFKGEQELQYLESVLEELERAETPRDLQEIRDELRESGYLKGEKRGKKQARPAALTPMEFRSTAGIRFYAGRNNRQNDLLTTKFASKRDLWLHTQKIHGCHVIVDGSQGPVDPQTITEAAIVAATFSKAKDSRNVPVDYCPVRQVKKPNGAKPGMVIYENYNTAYVTPDEGLVKKLRKAAQRPGAAG